MRNKDEFFMNLALEEALKGRGYTRTNPIVGAVITKDGMIISKGYHGSFGGDHAEVDAVKSASAELNGTTIYVTLEPCSTTGKTPPCTDLIVEKGFKRVVIGAVDPNPHHRGRGVDILKNRGIKVDTGILESKCISINQPFWTNMLKNRPFICLKLAMTLDGKIADSNNGSKWITGIESRSLVHKIRSEYDAVMVGKNTALHDNPSLNVRLIQRLRNPDRILVDQKLEIPLDYNIFSPSSHEQVYCIVNKNIDKAKLNQLYDIGAEPIFSEGHELTSPLKNLLNKNIGSILVEGGAGLAASLLKEKLVDKVMFFYAPKILGSSGYSGIGNIGVKNMSDSLKLENLKLTSDGLGGDFLVEAELNYGDV